MSQCSSDNLFPFFLFLKRILLVLNRFLIEIKRFSFPHVWYKVWCSLTKTSTNFVLWWEILLNWILICFSERNDLFPCCYVAKQFFWIVYFTDILSFSISQFKLLPHIRCLITFRIESSIISINSNITDNIIRKVTNV